MSFSIVPFDTRYSEGIGKLEQGIEQGRGIRLQIIKDHFLDRAVVFKKYHAGVVLNTTGEPIATIIGAKTILVLNGDEVNAGVGFDVKVQPAYRKKGIGKLMAKYLYKEFFKPEGLTRNFITLKISNIPVVRLASAVRNIWLYNFVYLTIPSRSRLKETVDVKGKKQLLSVTLFNQEEIQEDFYTTMPSGLAYFHTNKMYRLKINSIAFLFRLGIRIIKNLQPGKYAFLPAKNVTMEFATLYRHTAQNIIHINGVLEQLEKKGVNYLLVCCRKSDIIYNTLKKMSINTYGYYLLSDFSLNNKDAVTIDVRCL